MMENNVIVGLGELLWDVFPDRKVPGGAPANFAYHVGQLGLPGCVVSAVGRDALGAELLNVLKSKELGSYVEEVPFPTGTVQVTLDDAGVPQYEICEGVAWDNIPSQLYTLLYQRFCIMTGFPSHKKRIYWMRFNYGLSFSYQTRCIIIKQQCFNYMLGIC